MTIYPFILMHTTHAGQSFERVEGSRKVNSELGKKLGLSVISILRESRIQGSQNWDLRDHFLINFYISIHLQVSGLPGGGLSSSRRRELPKVSYSNRYGFRLSRPSVPWSI